VEASYKGYSEDKRVDILRTAFAPALRWKHELDITPLFQTQKDVNIVVVGGDPCRKFVKFPATHCNDQLVTQPITFVDGTPAKSVYDFK